MNAEAVVQLVKQTTKKIVDMGIEPMTSALLVPRSNHRAHRPKDTVQSDVTHET
jgi:hypothetical protein